jgi:hypothetical protein
MCFLVLDKYEYIAGITKRVRIRENITPPTITTPKGIRLVLASPKDNAMGSEPNAMAKLVINIGRRRRREACNTASILDNPSSRF